MPNTAATPSSLSSTRCARQAPHPVAGRGAQWHTDRARVRLAGHTQQRRRRLVRAGTGVGAAGQSEPGIGSRLIRQLLAELQERHAAGCVVLGDPNYYGRFGFQAQTALTLPGVPQDYFRAIAFQGALPCAEVAFHNAFNAEA